MNRLLNMLAVACLATCYLSCKKESPVKPPAEQVAITSLKNIDACTTAPQVLGIRTVGTPNEDNGLRVEISAAGHVSFIGSIFGTADFDPGPGVKNLSSSTTTGGFFSQTFDKNANFLNAVIASPYSASPKDKQGNIYRYIRENAAGGGNPGTCASPPQSFAIIKTAPNGSQVWKKTFTAGIAEWCSLFLYHKIDSNGDVIIHLGEEWFKITSAGVQVPFTGPVAEKGDFWLDAQNNIYFKHNAYQPAQAWVTKYNNSTMAEEWSFTLPFIDMTFDGSGNLYFVGTFSNTRDFNPGPGTFNMTAAQVSSMYIQKFDPERNFIWAKQFGVGTPNAIQTAPGGYLFVAGTMFGTQQYSTITGPVTVASKGARDAFIIAMQQCR